MLAISVSLSMDLRLLNGQAVDFLFGGREVFFLFHAQGAQGKGKVKRSSGSVCVERKPGR